MSPTYHEDLDTPEPERPRKISVALQVVLWIIGIAIIVGVCLASIYVFLNY